MTSSPTPDLASVIESVDVEAMQAAALAPIDAAIELLAPAVAKHAELQAFRNRLTGNVRVAKSSGAARPAAVAAPTGPGGKRVSRKEQFVQLVRDRPGIKVGEAAEVIGIDANYFYRVRSDAKDDGAIMWNEEGQHYPTEGPGSLPKEEQAAIKEKEELAARTAELEAASAE